MRIEVVPPGDEDALAILRLYMSDVGSSYWGRPVTAQEVEAALRVDPSDDLAPPSGFFLLARRGGRVVGCAALRLVPASGGAERVAEVKRVFVPAPERRRGVARALMAEVERRARGLGVTLLRLDTRADLTEALALYAALGYTQVPAYNEDRYSNRWFAKRLA